MHWYNNYPNEWKEIIETVSREYKRSEIMVEKDTIQSMFLHMLSASTIPFVFKGGTSLSKAYCIIDRFSEDIDLSMSRKPTESEKRKIKELILHIASELGLTISNPDKIRSRYDYNMYVFTYDSFFSDLPIEIIIETSFYQDSYPTEIHNISSLVGNFCADNRISLPIPFDAANTQMNVQSIERTFIDKVFAVCDYKIQDMQDRDSRHLYDISKILPLIDLNSDLKTLVDKVRKDRMKSKNNPSAQPEYDIPTMLDEIIDSKFFESDYKRLTQKLLYEDISYEQTIEHGIAIVAKTNIFK